MSHPAGNEPDKPPWYKRSILPSFIPEWTVLCVAIGGALAFVAAYAVDRRVNTYLAAAAGFGIGFCFAVFLEVYLYVMHPDARRPGMLPPLWLAGPITTAVLVALGATIVDSREMSFNMSGARGPVIHGAAAVIFGLLMIVAAGVVNVWMIVGEWGRRDRVVVGCVGALISLAGLVFAAVRVWYYLSS
jgi:hypothetical protein